MGARIAYKKPLCERFCGGRHELPKRTRREHPIECPRPSENGPKEPLA
jgi:hypothetical protein